MNIFATSSSPFLSAIWLDDLRLNKMILETAQLLCTAHHELGSGTAAMYKSTHKNHPCAIWARECRGNYLWLFEHFQALCNEYEFRRGKVHASRGLEIFLPHPPAAMPAGERTPFANCTPLKDYTVYAVNAAYRTYMRAKWLNDKRTPTFTKTGWPAWAADVPNMRAAQENNNG